MTNLEYTSPTFAKALHLEKEGDLIGALQQLHKITKKYSKRVAFTSLLRVLRKIEAISIQPQSYSAKLKGIGSYDVGLDELFNDILIVSLTSYPARITSVSPSIKSILSQSLAPSKIDLWLATEEFPNGPSSLPLDLLDLVRYGLNIQWCENIRSYKKIIPALALCPGNIIVTADDDLIYHQDWLLQLVTHHILCPSNVIFHRAHKIRFADSGHFLPYQSWEKEVTQGPADHSYFFTSGAGALFPPGSFHEDVLNSKLFLELSPSADDIWLWFMVVANNTNISLVPNSVFTLNEVEGTQDHALWKINVRKGENDKALELMTKRYPIVTIRARNCIKETKIKVKKKPIISVIIPVFNTGELFRETINSILSQDSDEYEIVCINDGSTDPLTNQILDEYSSSITNFRLIYHNNQGPASSRNRGIREARGDFIAFVDSDDLISPDYLSSLHKCLTSNQANIALCSSIYTFTNLGMEDKSLKNCGIDRPGVSRMELARRIINSTGVSWNKMYRKSFLCSNNICFLSDARCFAEDNYFTSMAIIHGFDSVVISNSGSYYYRKHSGSLVESSDSLGDYLKSSLVYKSVLNKILANQCKHWEFWFSIIVNRACKDLGYFASMHNLDQAETLSTRRFFKEKIYCCCIADHNYIVPSLVFLKSLKNSHADTAFIEIYLLVPRGSKEKMQVVESLSSSEFAVILKEVNTDHLDGLHKYQATGDFCMASPTAMIKFMIPEIFPYHDRILYLDSDMIIRSDLRSLFSLDLQDKLLAAATDMWEPVTDRESTMNYVNYFNSGVMLMNTRLMRERSLTRSLIFCKSQSLNNELMDQDVFNEICGTNMLPIDISYNFQTVCYKRHRGKLSLAWVNKAYCSNYRNIEDMARDPAIVHWAGSDKPWKDLSTLFSDEWLQIYQSLVNEGLVKDELLSFCKV